MLEIIALVVFIGFVLAAYGLSTVVYNLCCLWIDDGWMRYAAILIGCVSIGLLFGWAMARVMMKIFRRY